MGSCEILFDRRLFCGRWVVALTPCHRRMRGFLRGGRLERTGRCMPKKARFQSRIMHHAPQSLQSYHPSLVEARRTRSSGMPRHLGASHLTTLSRANTQSLTFTCSHKLTNSLNFLFLPPPFYLYQGRVYYVNHNDRSTTVSSLAPSPSSCPSPPLSTLPHLARSSPLPRPLPSHVPPPLPFPSNCSGSGRKSSPLHLLARTQQHRPWFGTRWRR